MQLNANTIVITGGGSGIGAGLAKAFHALGNKVIIAGRRKAQLNEVASAHPGMDVIELDVADPSSITQVADTLTKKYPTLNVLINNAGVMLMDDAGNKVDDATAVTQINTNLLGPIRLTSALMPLLKRQPRASIIYTSSTVGFTPLAPFAVYSATKAALHSFVLSQRFLLKDTRVTVQEIVPPWVGTGLVGAADHPLAIPLHQFIDGTMAALATEAEEVLVEEAKIYRNNAGPNEHPYVEQLNTFFLSQSF